MRSATINGMDMYCMPSSYPCTNFERSLLADSTRGIGERIYGHSEPYCFDDEGRQWLSEALIDTSVARFFLRNPTRYLTALQHRAVDFSVLRNKLRQANALLTARSAGQLARAIRLASEAYVIARKYYHLGQPLAGHWCGELRDILSRHLSRREANSYITSILEAPAAANAVERGLAEDTSGPLSIEAVRGPPIVVCTETMFPRAVVADANLHDRILHSEDSLATFWSLRVLAPLAVQLAEEFRYADYSSRTHLKYFLSRAGESSSELSDPYGLEWRELVALLEGEAATQTGAA